MTIQAKEEIDGLLWRERLEMLSKMDEAKLENYKLVYPDYFKREREAAK